MSFFQQMHRLKKWPWTGTTKRPSVAGKYVTDIVYERLGPGVLEQLEKKNPKQESGHRRAKHHQWLTEDVGHPALAQHLYAVIGLMRISETWADFKALLDRAYPKKDTGQFLLFN
jgi:hypothetical protein